MLLVLFFQTSNPILHASQNTNLLVWLFAWRLAAVVSGRCTDSTETRRKEQSLLALLSLSPIFWTTPGLSLPIDWACCGHAKQMFNANRCSDPDVRTSQLTHCTRRENAVLCSARRKHSARRVTCFHTPFTHRTKLGLACSVISECISLR
jgi:hypothetical protein